MGAIEIPQLAELAYPLNVYALLLVKEIGSANYLHYGHFDHPDESMEHAQNKAVNLLCSQLPTGGKILEVGCGFGDLTGVLNNAGYEVMGITPDPMQITIAKARHGDNISVKCSSLEAFCEGEGTWDVLLFHESSQYISMLDLLERASALLKPDGTVLILDEFANKRTEIGLETLHHKDHFLALASRFGFICLKDLDCTKTVMPTLTFLVRSLEKYSVEIADETGTSIDALEDLILSNCGYREKYRNGRFGYFLLHLQRQSTPERRLARIKKGDQPAVSDLFEKVFAQPLSAELWAWKYGPGRGQAIGLWEDGILIAHYGGIPRQLKVAGSLMTASQSCDVMVAPHARGALVRKGPFFQVCTTFLEQFVGYGTNQPLAFGFPNDRAYRLPHKLGLYTKPVTSIRELTWNGSKGNHLFHVLRPCDPTRPEDAAELDRLWFDMSTDLHALAVGIRDSAYWLHRYSIHPNYTYGLYFVYSRILRKNIIAFAVKEEAQRLELLDWVGQTKYLSRLISSARLLAAEGGLLQVWLLASLPIVERLRDTAPDETDPKIVVPENAWTAAPGIDILKNKLWLTGGDTDFL